jgi:Raf kinase inhibitor-like YbhB/YbcL family protein
MSLKLGNLSIASSAFGTLGRIPKRHAGDGDDLSPPLEWTGAPKATKEYALICFDPDAPLPQGFTHWVLYGIPATTTKLPEGQGPHLFTGGVNGAGKTGYVGPYPPTGHGQHHYYFWIYALDGALKLKSGLSKDQLLEAISKHILEQARVVGTYSR